MPLPYNSKCMFIIASLTLFSGCRNSCQQICIDIEKFAADCPEQYAFTDEMKSECMQNQGKKTWEEQSACQEAKSLLESEWTCDDLAIYFDQSTISGEGE